MDYRDHNPQLRFWNEPGKISHPFPYNYPRNIGVFEIDPPDHSTKFLGMTTDMSDDEQSFVSYLIEAPRHCPVRRSFEFGDITWEQYWSHKPWLIERRNVLSNNDGVHIRYISPSQMSDSAKKCIRSRDKKSPMLLKLEVLEHCVEFAKVGDPIHSYLKELEEFREKFPMIQLPTIKMPKVA